MSSPDVKPMPPDPLDPDAIIAAHPHAPWRLGHLMLMVAAIALVIWLFMISGALIVTLGIAIMFAVIFGGASLWARRVAARQDSLLRIIAIASEKGMPLAPAVAAFASQFGGRTRRRLFALATQLNAGLSLSQALGSVRKVLSGDSSLLAKVGEDLEKLPVALRMAAETRAGFLPASNAIVSQFTYILGMLLGLQAILGFILYFVMPKFEAIFKDFGVALPTATLFVINTSHQVIDGGLIALLIIFAELALVVVLPFRIMGWLNLEIPFLDRVFRRRHTALVLRSLSLAVDAGKPLEEGLESLSRHYPKAWVRYRITQALEDTRRGEDWCTALWRHGLIREADGALLTSASGSGNLAWALRELAETCDRRRLIRIQAALQLFYPFVVLMFGLVVLVVALAYFSPLVRLIDQLSEV